MPSNTGIQLWKFKDPLVAHNAFLKATGGESILAVGERFALAHDFTLRELAAHLDSLEISRPEFYSILWVLREDTSLWKLTKARILSPGFKRTYQQVLTAFVSRLSAIRQQSDYTRASVQHRAAPPPKIIRHDELSAFIGDLGVSTALTRLEIYLLADVLESNYVETCFFLHGQRLVLPLVANPRDQRVDGWQQQAKDLFLEWKRDQ